MYCKRSYTHPPIQHTTKLVGSELIQVRTTLDAIESKDPARNIISSRRSRKSGPVRARASKKRTISTDSGRGAHVPAAFFFPPDLRYQPAASSPISPRAGPIAREIGRRNVLENKLRYVIVLQKIVPM
ncbi:hypothetical protein EVAR_53990_1 [Eumeta japonica]|uniref:Uncharacterized protein n=1 Tax=Eumeta variegata TaxID=151549 RepID=A0A4C1YVA6_EUMVA|nr:hypothetical protein EVAR_53990_1 [Eumeta japonica]